MNAEVVVGALGWLYVRLRVTLCILGFERDDAVQRESEAGDPLEQPWRCDWSMIGPVMSVSPSWARTVIPSNAAA
jgi:hypothetical protein